MTKARLAPTLIYSGILISAGLTGCGGDNATTFPTAVNETADEIVGTIPEGQANYTNPDGSVNTDVSTVFNSTATYPIFDPANSDLPLQSDLLFATTTDGTPNLTDSSPPVTSALNDVDGFSPVGQIDIAFSGALKSTGSGAPKVLTTTNGFSSPLIDGQDSPNVMLIPLTTVDSACSASSGPAPINPLTITGVDTTKLATQSVRAEIITMTDPDPDDSTSTISKTVLRLSPTAPLSPKTKYLVAITNGLLDASDVAVGPSVAYNLLGQHTEVPEVADLDADCIPDELTGSGDFTPVPTQKAVPDFNSISSLVVSGENIARKMVDGFRQAAVVGGGGTFVDALRIGMDEFVISFMFTTGGTDDVLQNLAANVNVAAGVAAVAGTEDGDLSTNDASPLFASTIRGAIATSGLTLDIPQPRTVDFSFATSFDTAAILTALGATSPVNSKMIQGAITLPYYLDTPTLDPLEFSNSLFTPDQDYGDALQTAGITTLDVPIADCEVDATSTETCPSPSYNITYSFPYADKITDVTVPVLVSYPDLTTVNGLRALQGGSALTKPADGWPVVIFVPPLTSDRTSVLALANTLATGCAQVLPTDVTRCFATVVIDPPLHGITPNHPVETPLLAASLIPDYFNVDLSINSSAPTALAERHFGQYLGSIDLTALGVGVVPAAQPLVYDNPNTTGDESEGDSGSLFVNILNFGNTRDNMRQYVMDLLNLNASLTSFDFEGDSTGDLDTNNVYLVAPSITGAMGATFLAVNNDANVQAYNGLAQDGTGTGYLPYIQAAVLNNTGGGLAKMLENSATFGPVITGSLSGLGITQGSSTFELFMYALQNALDSVDPINFAADIVAAGTPLLAHEVIGDGGTTSGDTVVPNGADNNPTAPFGNAFAAPLSGTDPLYSALGLTHAGLGAIGAGSVIKYNTGSHGAMLSADSEIALDTAVQAEMIASTLAFFVAGGLGSASGTISAAVIATP